MRLRSAVRLGSLLLVLSPLGAGCSGNGGGGSGGGFQLTRISLQDGAEWKLNEELVFTFSEDVLFSSISLNTINIQTANGAPASGNFFLRGPRDVVFQPTCPRQDGLMDTGLQPGGIVYVVKVLGTSSGAANTVRSTSQNPLQFTQTRSLMTPQSSEPSLAFRDAVQGAPSPQAAWLEIGGDPDSRIDFEPVLANGAKAPLNLYSEPSTQFAVFVEFDQAIDPSSSNLSSNLIRLEFLDSLGVWQPLETRVTLEANCAESAGARVRLEPVGVLPQGGGTQPSIVRLRARVLPGFQDLVGQDNLGPIDNFALAPVEDVSFDSLSGSTQSDEFPESFDFGGDSPRSFQDTSSLFASPPADWGDGRLSAAFQFEGSGGPGGTFDWLVRNGILETIDTNGDSILSADGSAIQFIEDGIIDVRNMTIEQGGTVRVQGSRPLRIHATGNVVIRGTLDASGFEAMDVFRLNSGNLKEEGGAQGPGGGRGGTANEIVTNSTSQGSFGQGPLTEINKGGAGGETAFALESKGKDARRPGGGGGGRFAFDVGTTLVAESGFPGSDLGQGAFSQPSPALGGASGVGAFTDGVDENNFFGTKPVVEAGVLTRLIRGELPSLWGGYGGGGGGNADPANGFPTPNWSASSDEKGGAGGGGGGGLQISALGAITFGVNGLIRCNGGRGALGENTLGQDHVGGSGGSGSGGHVVLETATRIDFTDGGSAEGMGAPLRDWIQAVGGPRVTGAPTSGGTVSFGGAGGPGVVQLHVPRTTVGPAGTSDVSDIVVPLNATLEADPIDAVMSPAGIVVIPSFGAHSQARSDWISVGGADQKPAGVPSPGQVSFFFRGTETAVGPDQGKILATGDEVQPLPALLAEDLEGSPTATILPNRLTLQLTGASLLPFNLSTDGIPNDLYLRNPALLQGFTLRLSVDANPALLHDYAVASAIYDESVAGQEKLRMTVSDDGFDLVDFVEANTAAGTIVYALTPRFFRVVTGGVVDSLPANSFVRIRFQAAQDDGLGQPDETNLLVDWTGNIADFNALLPGQIQFFRFEVEFELDAQSLGVSDATQPVTLEFLRVPFFF